MDSRAALRSKAGTLYRVYIEPRVTLVDRGRPRLDVSDLRTFVEYLRLLPRSTGRNGHRSAQMARSRDRGPKSSDRSKIVSVPVIRLPRS